MTTPLLVTGGTGQVGRSLLALPCLNGFVWDAPARNKFDLSDATAVGTFMKSGGYAGVINCAAYTAVDRAETEPSRAFAVNAMAPAVLAEATARAGIPMIQLSTDYVFDGRGDGPYKENARVDPLNVYGASKLAGELAVSRVNPRHVILRTAWVVSPFGQNFIKTMLRLAAERPELRVVSDQFGCPTSAQDIAAALVRVLSRLISDEAAPTGIFNFVNAGRATWDELAREVFDKSTVRGGPSAQVVSISTSDYPTPARRPGNSQLATDKIANAFGIIPRPWRTAIGEIVETLVPLSQEHS